MSAPRIELPPGQYSAGSVQVRTAAAGLYSDPRPLGPMISPFAPYGMRVEVLSQDATITVGGDEVRALLVRFEFIGQIQGSVTVSGTYLSPPLVEATDPYGRVTFELTYPLNVAIETNEIFTSYELVMEDFNQQIPDTTVGLELPYVTYTYDEPTGSGSDTSLIVSAPIFQYSLDAGVTWTQGTSPVQVPDGIYPFGSIKVRPGPSSLALDDEFVGAEFSLTSVIVPYQPIDVRVDPNGSGWNVYGIGDPGVTVQLLDENGDPVTQTVEGVVVNVEAVVGPYGEFTLSINSTANIDGQDYTLFMSKSGFAGGDYGTPVVSKPFTLQGSSIVSFAGLNPPNAIYVPGETEPGELGPNVEIEVDQPVFEYTFDGGLTGWINYP
jgi:hypothetical protein